MVVVSEIVNCYRENPRVKATRKLKLLIRRDNVFPKDISPRKVKS